MDSRGQTLQTPPILYAILIAAIVTYVSVSLLLDAVGRPQAADLRQAQSQVVTNCEVGPACGMGDLVILFLGIVGVLLAGVAVRAMVRRARVPLTQTTRRWTMENSVRLLAVALLVVAAGCVSAPMASTPTSTDAGAPTAEPPSRDEIQLKDRGTINASYLNRSAATVYRTYAAGAERPCPRGDENTSVAVQCSAALTPVDRARQVMHSGVENETDQDLKAGIAYAASVYSIVNESVEWEQWGPNSRLDDRLTPAAKHEFDVAFGFLVLAYHELQMSGPVEEENRTGNADKEEADP